jgi:hypothetical protein
MVELHYERLPADPTALIVTGAGPGPFPLLEIRAQVIFEGTPCTVREIGASAFRNATFATISLPASLQVIHQGAFRSNRQLTKLDFSGPSQLTEIGASAFEQCDKLTDLSLPPSVTTLGPSAFRGCTNLRTVRFGAAPQLRVVGHSCFAACDLQWAFTFPDGVQKLEDGTFQGNSHLLEIKFGARSALTWIGSLCFDGTTFTALTLPAGLQTLAPAALKGTQIESITIPDTVTVIDAGALEALTTLREVKFGANSQLARLGARALAQVDLSMLTLPASLTVVEDAAFSGADNLLLIKFPPGSQLQAVTKGTFEGSRVEDVELPAIQAIADDAFDNVPSLKGIKFVEPPGLPEGEPLPFPPVVLKPPWQEAGPNYFRRP